jgi:TATA-binding protein-associated factor
MKEDVLHDLPPKIIQDYYCEMSQLQQQLYDDFAQSQMNHLTHDGQSGGTSKHIFQALQYMRKLVNHPSLVVNESHPKYHEIQQMCASDGLSIQDISHAPKLLALRDLLQECGIGVASSSENGGDNGPVSSVSPHRALIFCQLKTMVNELSEPFIYVFISSISF